MNSTLPLHNDEPTSDDRLGRAGLVQRVAEQIAVCKRPQVLGVHGDWGAGKTSFLLQLGKALESRREVTVVNFEAWRYQHEAVPVVALLHEIRGQLSWSPKIWSSLGKAAEVTVRSALLSWESLTKVIGIQASKIQESGELWEKEKMATALPSRTIRLHLEKAVTDLIGEEEHRLVVLVDDLDRCQPASALALLEGIKIYLNLSNCVFVLGMNQKVVEAAIANQLPDAEKKSEEVTRRRSREYLEKICQNFVHLPLMHDPARYLYDLLDGVGERGTIHQVVREFDCLPANARKVKAFANLLRQHAKLLPQAGSRASTTEEDSDANRAVKLFLVMACLYQHHPELYRLVEAHRKPFYDRLRRWAEGTRRIDEQLEHPQLRHLQDAWEVTSDEQSATRELRLGGSTFADPVEGNVLRIQKLIVELGPVTRNEIETFLLDRHQ